MSFAASVWPACGAYAPIILIRGAVLIDMSISLEDMLATFSTECLVVLSNMTPTPACSWSLLYVKVLPLPVLSPLPLPFLVTGIVLCSAVFDEKYREKLSLPSCDVSPCLLFLLV